MDGVCCRVGLFSDTGPIQVLGCNVTLFLPVLYGSNCIRGGRLHCFRIKYFIFFIFESHEAAGSQTDTKTADVIFFS